MKYPLLTLFLLSTVAFGKPHWSVFMYMETAGDLSHAAIKNIQDLVQGYSKNSAHVDIRIQLHCLAQEGDIGSEAYRFEVMKDGLRMSSSVQLTFNATDDFVTAAQWGLNPQADHHMIIAWGHGFGILNPEWKENADGAFDWWPEADELMQYACHFKRLNNHESHRRHRALLFHQEPRTYMTMSAFAQALQNISNQTLAGKKIDILGMDMCMMSMIEIGKEVMPFVDVLIGSQDCELEYGWDYAPIFARLGSEQATVIEVARSIIQAYDIFYTKHAPRGTYTQSALQLNKLPALLENIDRVSRQLQQCANEYGKKFFATLKKLRKELPRFCLVPMYTDLYAFYENLEQMLPLFNDCPVRAVLEEQLTQGMEIMQEVVCANCFGRLRDYAHGISIYFPLSHIDSSYHDCSFAQQTHWLEVLECIVPLEC